MTTFLTALGIILSAEGLILALIPHHFEELLRRLSEMTIETRRALGLGSLALGVILVWVARLLA